MTAWIESKTSFHITDRAVLLDDTKEMAWAEKVITPNPVNGWVLGKYVEADNANSNRQYFGLEGLRMAKPTIQNAPMNINHVNRRVVGAFVAAELVYPLSGSEDPTEAAAAELGMKPYIEALGVVWKHYFPDEYKLIQQANAAGMLFYSMEAIPREIQCIGDAGCQEKFAYQGPTSVAYCAHLNDPHKFDTAKMLIDPHFVGGALIIPPERPGWKDANVSQIAGLMSQQLERAEAEISSLGDDAAEQWQSMMAQIVTTERSRRDNS